MTMCVAFRKNAAQAPQRSSEGEIALYRALTRSDEFPIAGIFFTQRTHHDTMTGELSSVGILGLPCLDLRILSGLLRRLVQLALLDALELLNLVLPVQRVQVLPTLELSDLQTRAAAGSERPSSVERKRASVWRHARFGAPSSC